MHIWSVPIQEMRMEVSTQVMDQSSITKDRSYRVDNKVHQLVGFRVWESVNQLASTQTEITVESNIQEAWK